MYCDKENINILTSLLVSHGVRHVVVCPGSRNAAIVHNLNECPDIVCHPVTDERSAGFFALGVRQMTGGNVAVCVTSGSALLNVIPAAAEATYQNQGIIVISADRPSAWIGQMDGQAMPQPGALGSFVGLSVTLPEPHDDVERWECNRKVNEALMEVERPSHPSVHINVPISEPLFRFTVPELPRERVIRRVNWGRSEDRVLIMDRLKSASRPMVVTGQIPREETAGLKAVSDKVTVLWEPLSADMPEPCFTEQMMCALGDVPEEYRPDCVVYIGGNTVSKRLRGFLRDACADAFHIVFSADGALHDVSCHTNLVVEGDLESFLGGLASISWEADFRERWRELRRSVAEAQEKFTPEYSQMLAVKMLEERVRKGDVVHYANSMSVRLGEIYAKHYCFCNRGLNGIDGSLGTAAGAAVAMASEGEGGRLFCVTGDLSFFYDENALWQNELGGNFRILLLNNSQGGIFKSVQGLDACPVRDAFVAGGHSYNAEGICRQFGVRYLKAENREELERGLDSLCAASSDRPVLLEVTTDAETDVNEYKRCYYELEKN